MMSVCSYFRRILSSGTISFFMTIKPQTVPQSMCESGIEANTMTNDNRIYSEDSNDDELLFNELHRVVFGISFDAEEKGTSPGTSFMIRVTNALIVHI
jgi:hypothetical protein